jgi:hypothetical protein
MFFGHFHSKIDSFILPYLEIRTGSHTSYETAFYNFDSLGVLAMDCFQEVVASCFETLSKTFLSLSHISCNPISGKKNA